MKILSKITFAALLITGVACSQKPTQEPEKVEINLMIKSEKVGEYAGKDVFKYTLNNGTMQVELSNFGGLISRIEAPDKNGNLENVTLTMDSVEEYLTRQNPFFGATAGRVANRIANAEFTLDGTKYTLAKTNGDNHLHGGVEGFNKKVWTGEPYSNDSTIGVKMTYLSPDGEEGYPGNLETTLWMELTTDNTLRIRFEATTDKKTIVNLTNHTYFNLSGVKGDVKDHEFQFWADYYTPVDEELIPTGEVKDVTGTPFDFRTPKILGDQMEANGEGFDHNMVMKLEKSPDMKHFVRVKHPVSGRVMDMYSDNNGVQFYTANFLSDFAGADGITYGQHWGFCLESQNWPDAINHDNFPSPVLNPGEKYEHTIEYKFSVEQ
ncbi:aldose epimerase family protein [Algoriphagus sp. CAU 1675]|uniref:aldose epimerase family protein n=1 Tax=Algoriphagus sp. CAU 1675 TaxID=3032597 RepID=UPI0023DC9CF9|nr:aldose epimerase family protein [Algoriphagus sp. CAU 1675]MDF2159135.1 galactose mutarotase [Algoriphagus sp. CAU 1675]